MHTTSFPFVFILGTALSSKFVLIMIAELARCYGGGLKAGALSMHFTRNIRPNVQLIQGALGRGEDPIGVAMLESVRSDKPGKRQAYSYSHSYTHCTFSFRRVIFVHDGPLVTAIDISSCRNCSLLWQISHSQVHQPRFQPRN
jgi:hypothetical protein